MSDVVTQSVGRSLGKDDFMKLLVTQLEYQDPLKPMESTEFIAQLAQFSALEGITNVEKGIEKMTNYMVSMNNSYLTGLIGKGVKTDTQITGNVDGIVFENGTPYLMVDGNKVGMGSVVEVF